MMISVFRVGDGSLLSGKTDHTANWWQSGIQQVREFLLTFKKRKARRELIGIVISPQYLKLLKLKRNHQTINVEYFSIHELPAGAMTDLEIKKKEVIAQCLKEMMGKLDMQASDVVLGIPRSSTIVKNISVDHRLNMDEIESRVWMEANRLFPNLIGEIYLDFVVTGATPNDAAKQDVMIVACRKEQLEPYLEILHAADLSPRIVDVNYYAYERALSTTSKYLVQGKTFAFLSVNFGMLTLLGMQDDKLIYANELTYDGHALLKLRREHGNEDNADNTEVFKQILGLHLKHALQFFYSSRPNVRVDIIILGGDVAATVPGLSDYISKEVCKEVVLANPFVDMKLAANIDKASIEHYAPALMLCCGLALTRLGA